MVLSTAVGVAGGAILVAATGGAALLAGGVVLGTGISGGINTI